MIGALELGFGKRRRTPGEMARVPVMAAGGIVLRRPESSRRQEPPQFAVVRLRKRDEWVLPKGKLDHGETARDAAEREVWEETGHDVSVHEFLGTLVYESGGRCKVVHYWRMEAAGGPSRELMNDIRAVDWLPLEAALGRLSRTHERAFLAHVGPLAIESARQQAKARRIEAVKRRGRSAVAAEAAARPPVPARAEPTAGSTQHQPALLEPSDVIAGEACLAPAASQTAAGVTEQQAWQDARVEGGSAEDLSAEDPSPEDLSPEDLSPEDLSPEDPSAEDPSAPDVASLGTASESGTKGTGADDSINLLQKLRNWLRRAA
jgi:8-oxo-dGTP diphosphatase